MPAKVALALVTNRQVKPKTVLSLLNMVSGRDNIVPIVATEGYTTAENRNYAAVQAIKEGCTHLLFVDDDMTFPRETLDLLMDAMQKKSTVGIVGVDSKSRKLPARTTVAFMDDNGDLLPHDQIPNLEKHMPNSPFECFSVGMGVALIDMKVFHEMKKPWFAYEVHENGKILVGEDAWFCIQARKHGFETWCEPSIHIGHLGDYEYGVE